MEIIGVSGQVYNVIGWGYHPDPMTGNYNSEYCEGYFATREESIVHFHNVRKVIGDHLPKWIAQHIK